MSLAMKLFALRRNVLVSAAGVLLLVVVWTGALDAAPHGRPTGSIHVNLQESSHNAQVVVPDVTLRTELIMPDVARRVVDLERQGHGRKIISMSLYGAEPRYTLNAVYNAMVAQRDWPDWTLRVYYGQNVPPAVVELISAFGAETVAAVGYKADVSTVWRFFALEDRTATRVIMRDADARLSRRDRLAVEEWMATDWPVHIMHDHQLHEATVLAGMWGAVAGYVHPRLFDQWRRPSAAVGSGQETAAYGADQDWLRSTLWPLVRNATLNHASWHCGKFGEAEWRPFPVLRNNSLDFVGQVHSVKSLYNGDIQVEVCPVKCRQPDTSDC